jgi:hypothetical protein
MRLDLKMEFMKVISEISVRYYDKLRNKVSYESYCERLAHTIKNNGLLGISQRNMISTIIDEFKSIYGMSEELSADLVWIISFMDSMSEYTIIRKQLIVILMIKL